MKQLISIILLIALGGCAAGTLPDPARMDEATFERELAIRFHYEAPEPPEEVSDPLAGRVLDATHFANFPRYDRSYTPETRHQAQRLAESLAQRAGQLSHEQFVLSVAEIAALADNAHTAIDENAFKKNTPRLPLRTYLFADDLHVLWTIPEQRDLLGARIDTIDGHSVDAVYRSIRRYVGGTEAHRRVTLIPMLESPALLHAAGIADARGALTLSGVLADGSAFERRIMAEERGRAAWVSSTSRTLFPRRPGGPMLSLLAPDADLPVYLRHSSELFTMEALPGNGLYVGLGFNGDSDDAPIATFLADVGARLSSVRPSFVVLDMRMNGGGDYTLTYRFARELPRMAQGAPIYALTSPFTFSAAITTLGALEEVGGDQVIIVGEPVGDRLDFWAEGGAFTLPNAFVQVYYASGRHVYDGPCSDARTCFWLNERYPVRVQSLSPDIHAPLTFEAYRQLRDPAIEAVQAHLRGD